MPFWRLFYHVVWATKGREPVIDDRVAEVVVRAVKAGAVDHGVVIHAIAAMPEHVHVAVSIPPKVGIPVVIGRWKGASSHLLNHAERDGDTNFAWQAEYGILSFGAGALPRVTAYVRDQRTHHAEGRLWPLLERDLEDPPIFSRLQPGSSPEHGVFSPVRPNRGDRLSLHPRHRQGPPPMSPTPTPTITPARLHASLDALAQIGATVGGGVTRLALSDEDKAGRDRLRSWLEEAGLTVRVDDFGNISGRRAGTEAGPALLLASHIDSVRDGGRYDGAYGVLAALEVVRTLNDLGRRTRRPIEVVAWTNEEGVRFEPAMLCSGAVAGRFGRDYVYGRTDCDGKRFEDELRRIGALGDAADRPGPAAACLELHIEQGPALEAAGQPVGIVEGIVGITWLELTITGRADHAGPSPMPLRRDALAAAARIVLAVQELALATEGAVGTVGRLAPEPNLINTIPGRVVMSADFRHRDPATLDALVAALAGRAAEVAAESGVTIALDRFWTSEPTPFAAEAVAAVAAACAELGLAAPRLWSGAGHDAKYVQALCPTAMVFVRSRDGLSHAPGEHSSPEDLAAGADVLLHAALRLADAPA